MTGVQTCALPIWSTFSNECNTTISFNKSGKQFHYRVYNRVDRSSELDIDLFVIFTDSTYVEGKDNSAYLEKTKNDIGFTYYTGDIYKLDGTRCLRSKYDERPSILKVFSQDDGSLGIAFNDQTFLSDK